MVYNYMTENKKIRVAGLVNDSIVDGPGFRFTVFVQGCPHHCDGCHNPETWDFAGGTEMTPEEIMERAGNNPLRHGFTFSGGEPFAQSTALVPLAKLVKEQGMELAIYTGFLFEEITADPEKRALAALADVVIDGPFIRKEKNLTLKFKGSNNQRIIDAAASLAAGKVVLNTSERWN